MKFKFEGGTRLRFLLLRAESLDGTENKTWLTMPGA